MNRKGKQTLQATVQSWNLPREMKFGCEWEMEPSMGIINASPPLLGFFFLKPSKTNRCLSEKTSLLELVFFSGLWNSSTTLKDQEGLYWCYIIVAICVSELSWIHWVADTQIHCIVFWVVSSESLNVAIALISKVTTKKPKGKGFEII